MDQTSETIILKLLNKDISDQLPVLFNQSFSSVICSSILTTSKIIPMCEKGSRLKYSSYRTIYSLSNNIGNILEKLVCNGLTNCWRKNELIFLLESGFRQIFSPKHAPIHLLNKTKNKIDRVNYVSGISGDFQKALGHLILLKKLELSQRQRAVCFNNLI